MNLPISTLPNQKNQLEHNQPDGNKADLVVGIIGGLGPAATFDFCQRIVRLTWVNSEQDHLQLLVDNNPKAPDRNKAIAGNGPSPAKWFAASAGRLATAGADFLVMPCNTAHAFAPVIVESTALPFVHMVDETVGLLKQKTVQGERIGLLAADGCMQSRLYQDRLAVAGLEPVILDEQLQKQLMDTIYQIKRSGTGDDRRSEMRALAQQLERAGANHIIAACTEVPLVLAAEDIDVPFWDTTELLAGLVVAYAKNQRPLMLSDAA